MILPAVILCLVTQTGKVDRPTLEFYQQAFVIRKGDQSDRVPLSVPTKAPPSSVMYRRDQTFVVWDDRGLTIRVKDKVTSTHLPELPVSPRVYSREEIRKNLAMFDRGERLQKASALSGSKRIGNLVYLLTRWDDRNQRPWLETLVSVDLSAPNPKPVLVGRFDGLTLSRKLIDEQMFVQDGKLNVITQGEDTWGMSSYDLEAKAFDRMTLGDRLRQFQPIKWPLSWFVEDTAYGATVAGQVNLSTGDRRNLAESDAPLRFLDDATPPMVILSGPDGPAVRNLHSAAELTLPKSYGIKRSKQGVVVWTPVTDPKQATLYDPERWEVLSTWDAPPVRALPASKP